MKTKCFVAIWVVFLIGSNVFAQDELEKRASWELGSVKQAKADLDAWLKDQTLDALAKAKIDAIWSIAGESEGDVDLLEQIATSIASVYDPAKDVLKLCSQDYFVGVPAKFEFLKDEKTPEFIKSNLRAYYGRWLALNRFYDESLEQMNGLKPEQVVDPAALLFYQSTSYHRLLQKEKCLPTLTKLLENEKHLPRRFTTLAQLMEADLKPLKKDSLDEISRLMDEIARRLDLGRAGKRVRKQEDDVIAKLDKMIEKMEEQAKQQQSQSSSSGGQRQSARPAQDSGNFGGSGPGDVEQRSTGKGKGWGNLPPKQREEALQLISKELPAHYREVIEEYFRKLARDGTRENR